MKALHLIFNSAAQNPEYKVNHRKTALRGYTVRSALCVQEQAGLWPKDVGLSFQTSCQNLGQETVCECV